VKSFVSAFLCLALILPPEFYSNYSNRLLA